MKRATILFLSLFLLKEGLAFKPHFPETKTWKAADGSAEVTIVLSGWTATLEEKAAKKKHKWEGTTEYPSKMFILPKHRKVVLVGGHGEPGVDLGKIWVRSYEGKALAAFDLTKEIPNLEKMSEDFTNVGGPFFWIGKTEVSADEKTVKIAVCDKVPVTLDVVALKLSK